MPPLKLEVFQTEKSPASSVVITDVTAFEEANISVEFQAINCKSLRR